MSDWRLADSRPELDRQLAGYIGAALSAQLAESGRATLAVSGGSTPRGIFRLLSDYPLDWSLVTVTLVDERWVPTDHPDSNERLVRENLLQGRAGAADWVGLKTDQADAREGLQVVGERLAQIPTPLSLTLLGMGADGHTASWFPRAANLDELLDPGSRAIVGACDPVTAPHQRITMTLPMVLNSRELVIHITGEDKRRVLNEAAAKGLPVARILHQSLIPVTVWWAP